VRKKIRICFINTLGPLKSPCLSPGFTTIYETTLSCMHASSLFFGKGSKRYRNVLGGKKYRNVLGGKKYRNVLGGKKYRNVLLGQQGFTNTFI